MLELLSFSCCTAIISQLLSLSLAIYLKLVEELVLLMHPAVHVHEPATISRSFELDRTLKPTVTKDNSSDDGDNDDNSDDNSDEEESCVFFILFLHASTIDICSRRRATAIG